MDNKVKIVLVGIGGYGNNYLEELLNNSKYEKNYEIAGVVDPYPQGCKGLEDIRRLGISEFSSQEEFYSVSGADLAIISSPIQFHCEQTCTALSRGSNVLCEKPAAAVAREVRKMIDERNKAGKFVAIGFQWSFSKAVLDLKRNILDGKFGKPRRLKTIVLWPRNLDYYARGWAGRKRDNAGRWILDSVAANATSHYLHNMFFLLGNEMDRSARLETLKAEIYRANDIENYDTSIIRAFTADGAEILFAASHAIPPKELKGPVFEYVFDNAVIKYSSINYKSENIKAFLNNGTVIDYGCPNDDSNNKLWASIKAARGGEAHLHCGLEAALTHTACIDAVQESVPDALEFPKELRRFDDAEKVVYVEGLSDILIKCYDEWKLPSELETPWACGGKEVNLSGYFI